MALGALALAGCAVQGPSPPASPVRTVADSHFHIANYAMQGVPLRDFVDRYMGDRVQRSVVFGLPLQQKWSPFEHYADDRIPPNYYMGPRADLYYYSYIDAMLAAEYRKLSAQDRARLDPMIVGFNPMDRYATQHVRRALLMFPGVFVGIGEFSVHKEIVADKIADDTVASEVGAGPLPPDVNAASRNTLYSPALESVLDFAGEVGLVVTLHSDIYPTRVTYDGRMLDEAPASPVYTDGMKRLCRANPKVTVVWAHTGLGRFVKPTADHLQRVAEILDSCPNWSVDLSWDLVQAYIVAPGPGMPATADWASFVVRYQDRVLWGSDTVIYTRNRVDASGRAVRGGPMPVPEYRAVIEILEPFWPRVGPEVAGKVAYGNHVRLFDGARHNVRAWEAAHAGDSIWDLPD